MSKELENCLVEARRMAQKLLPKEIPVHGAQNQALAADKGETVLLTVKASILEPGETHYRINTLNVGDLGQATLDFASIENPRYDQSPVRLVAMTSRTKDAATGASSLEVLAQKERDEEVGKFVRSMRDSFPHLFSQGIQLSLLEED